jgi:hypothetical protein
MRYRPCIALILVAIGSWAATALAQTSSSAPIAKQLLQEMVQRKVDMVAAKDPGQPEFYVAASYVQGVELIVVSARSKSPAYLDDLLQARRYADVYASLNGASFAEGKLFVQDIKADGLAAGREKGGSFDIVYQDVVKTIMFNGDWEKQGLTESQYTDTFKTLDARYARLLSLLLSQLKSGG